MLFCFFLFGGDFLEDDKVEIFKDVLVFCLFFELVYVFGYEMIMLLVIILCEGLCEVNLILIYFFFDVLYSIFFYVVEIMGKGLVVS